MQNYKGNICGPLLGLVSLIGDDWLRMMGVISKDYMHLKGKKKHFLNIFNDFLILNEAFLRRARDL